MRSTRQGQKVVVSRFCWAHQNWRRVESCMKNHRAILINNRNNSSHDYLTADHQKLFSRSLLRGQLMKRRRVNHWTNFLWVVFAVHLWARDCLTDDDMYHSASHWPICNSQVVSRELAFSRGVKQTRKMTLIWQSDAGVENWTSEYRHCSRDLSRPIPNAACYATKRVNAKSQLFSIGEYLNDSKHDTTKDRAPAVQSFYRLGTCAFSGNWRVNECALFEIRSRSVWICCTVRMRTQSE